MIRNEKQFKITRAQLERFDGALRQFKASEELHPLLREAERAALLSQRDSLAEEIAEYEALRSGARTHFPAGSVEELAEGLIRARIARGWTQRELAERLGLKEQQIQRYEATNYASADLARVQQVMQALHIRLQGQADLLSNQP